MGKGKRTLDDQVIEAAATLDMIREVITPEPCIEHFDPQWLGQSARYGLAFSLDRVAETMDALNEALIRAERGEKID